MTRSLDQALLQGADVSAMASMNLLVNGFHSVSQENGATAKAVSGSTAYITDQWQVTSGTAGVALTGQQVAFPFPSQPDIQTGLKINVTTALSTLTTTDYVITYQPVEGINLAKLLWGAANARPVTLAFMIRPSITLSGYFALRSLNSGGSTIRTFLHKFNAAANTDNFVTFTIPGDQAQGLLTGTVASLQALWCFGAGASLQGAPEQWLSGNYLCGADCTNLAATVGNNVVISGAVMLPGIVPISQGMLPLLARPYDDELRKCMRYYEIGSGNELFLTSIVGQYSGGTKGFAVPKRAVPTITLTSPTTNTGTVSADGASFTGFRFFLTSNTTGNGAFSSYWAANARM